MEEKDGSTEQLENWAYDGISIISIDNRMNLELSHSLIIIKKEDLPYIIHSKLPEEKVIKYDLEEIDKENMLYASIIDFNDTKFSAVMVEVQKNTNIKDLSKSVLVCVDFNTEVRCKNTAKCIQFKLYSQFDDQVAVNKIEDIKAIW